MRRSIFLHFKKGLIYSAMLSTLILAGCQLPGSNNSTPIQPSTPAHMKTDVEQYQSIIDSPNSHPSIDVLRAYIAQEPLLSDPVAKQNNIDGLWQMLTHKSSEQIQGIGAEENILQGWIDLVDIYQNNHDDAVVLKTGYDDWKMRYPNNPGVKMPPTQLAQAMLPPISSTPKIALLLPLSGQGKVFGEALMQGFMDAQKGLPKVANKSAKTSSASELESSADNVLNPIYPEVKTTDTNQPIDASNATAMKIPEVKVYDTASQPIEQLLKQAHHDGHTLIVGPLLKANVQKAANSATPINILALNELEANQLTSRPNLCYFSLSPEDEARNAALHIAKQGKTAPLLLIPSNPFGERIASAFAEAWVTNSDTPVLKQSFGSIQSLKASINRGSGIRMIGTQVLINSAPITSESETDSSNTPQTNSIDAVYIVATRDEITLLKPMIEMANSTRSRPALYASSRSNQAGTGTDFRLEMDGIQFSEIPLLAGTNNELLKQVQQKLPRDYSLIRLYAMGMDAWLLANNYNQLQQNSQFSVDGASGTLAVKENCIIYRQLPWMVFSKGQIKPIN